MKYPTNNPCEEPGCTCDHDVAHFVQLVLSYEAKPTDPCFCQNIQRQRLACLPQPVSGADVPTHNSCVSASLHLHRMKLFSTLRWKLSVSLPPAMLHLFPTFLHLCTHPRQVSFVSHVLSKYTSRLQSRCLIKIYQFSSKNTVLFHLNDQLYSSLRSNTQSFLT